jgi:hypothetical protein
VPAGKKRGTDEEEEREDERPWEQPAESEVRRDCEPHRGTIILTLGVVSLVAPVIAPIVGIIAILMGRADLRKMENGEMDPEGKGVTLAGWICAIIGTIFQSIFLLLIVLYIVFIFVMLASIARIAPPPPRPAAPQPAPGKMNRLAPGTTPGPGHYFPQSRNAGCCRVMPS